MSRHAFVFRTYCQYSAKPPSTQNFTLTTNREDRHDFAYSICDLAAYCRIATNWTP